MGGKGGGTPKYQTDMYNEMTRQNLALQEQLASQQVEWRKQQKEYQTSREEEQQRLNEEAEKARLEEIKQREIGNRDTLFSDFKTAAERANSYAQGKDLERSVRAKLAGVDYQKIDEVYNKDRQTYFDEIWSGDKQGQLEKYIEKYGNPEGFGGFDLGFYDSSEGPSIMPVDQKTATQSTMTKTAKPKSTLLTNEDVLGTKSTLLGG